MQPALRYCFYSQALLVLTVMICTFIAPQYLLSSNQGGISNYAVHFNTAITFSLGFVASAWLLVTATHLLKPYKKVWPLLPWLRLVAAGYVLLLISTFPYKYNILFQDVHLYTSIAFSLLLLIMTLRFARFNHNDAPSLCALIVIAAGFILGVATLTDTLHLLFLSQLLIGAGFGGALLHTAAGLTAHHTVAA